MTAEPVLLSVALPLTDPDTLLRIVDDAARVGAARLHLPDGITTDLVRAIRSRTALLLSGGADTPGTELTGSDHPSVAGHTVFTAPGGSDPLLVEMTPAAAATDAALVAAVSTRLAALPVDGPPRSVVCQGPRSVTVALTTLAAGAHLRVGPGIGAVVVRDEVAAVARVAALARLTGRLPLTAVEARTALHLPALG